MILIRKKKDIYELFSNLVICKTREFVTVLERNFTKIFENKALTFKALGTMLYEKYHPSSTATQKNSFLTTWSMQWDICGEFSLFSAA